MRVRKRPRAKKENIIQLPTLPLDLWEKIASFLDLNDFYCLVQTCRRFFSGVWQNIPMRKRILRTIMIRIAIQETLLYPKDYLVFAKCKSITVYAKNGLLDAGIGEPTIRFSDGEMEWYLRGKRHRHFDNPAIIRANGDKEWYVNDQRHRENGLPAVIRANGEQEWWEHGKRIK